MFLVDTNVLLDIRMYDARWQSWSERAIPDALVTGPGAAQAASAPPFDLVSRGAGQKR